MHVFLEQKWVFITLVTDVHKLKLGMNVEICKARKKWTWSCHMHHKNNCVDFETIASTAVDKAKVFDPGLS